MNLKKATLIAIVGTSLFLLHGILQVFGIRLYRFLGQFGEVFLFYSFPACLLVFLITLHRRQP